MVYAGDSGFEGQIEDAVIPSVKFMCCWKVLSCDTISLLLEELRSYAGRNGLYYKHRVFATPFS